MEQLGAILDDGYLRQCIFGTVGCMHWLSGLRASCRRMWRLIPTDWRKFWDEEDMLLEGAAEGDLGLCLYALSLGACQYFDMQVSAAKGGHYSVFRLAASLMIVRSDIINFGDNLGSVPYVQCERLMTAALLGGDRRVIAYVRENVWRGTPVVLPEFVCMVKGVLLNTMYKCDPHPGMELLVDILKWVPASTAAAIRFDSIPYVMYSYGYTGNPNYVKCLEGLQEEGSSAGKMIMAGALMSGNWDGVEEARRMINDGTAQYSAAYSATRCKDPRVFKEMAEGANFTDEQWVDLANSAGKCGNLGACYAIMEKKPGLVSLNDVLVSIAYSDNPIACELVISKGADCINALMDKAGLLAKFKCCQVAMSHDAPLDIFFSTALINCSTKYCRMIVSEGARRFNAALAGEREFGKNILQLFNVSSANELRAGIATGQLPTKPFLCVVLSISRRTMLSYLGIFGKYWDKRWLNGSNFEDKIFLMLEKWMGNAEFMKTAKGYEVHPSDETPSDEPTISMEEIFGNDS